MKISTRGRYALEAVVDLAVHSATECESLKSIAGRSGISDKYLEQIFLKLRKNGIVESIRGVQGGYRLARDAREITAGDVIRAAEGQLAPVACIAEGGERQDCGRFDTCITRVLWAKIMNEMNAVADSVSVRDLVESCNSMNKQMQIEYYI